MALYALLASQKLPCVTSHRWVILDLNWRGMADAHAFALAHLLSSHLQLVDGSEPDLLSQYSAQQKRHDLDARLIMATTNHLTLVLTEPETRHSVSNVVGPMLLLAGMERQEKTSSNQKPSQAPTSTTALDLLKKVMNLLQMIPAQSDREPAPWIVPGEWQRDIEKLILIDDLHDLGWADFLKKALGIGADEQVFLPCKSPIESCLGRNRNASLMDLLVEQADGGEQLRVNQDVSLSGSQKEIVFLDLRLFSRGAAGEERKTFVRLLKLARQVQEGHGNLPWPGFSQAEIDAVQQCVDTPQLGDGSSEYHIALTLLPRLLALVAPRLPIVIFSSTGQRTILQALERYGTIALEFEKPRLFPGASGVGIAETKQKFLRAFRQAVRIARGRHTVTQLLSKCQGNLLQGSGLSSSDIKHVDLYFDEGGRTNMKSFRIACLAIGHRTLEDSDTFNRWMVGKHLLWGPVDLDSESQSAQHDYLPKCDALTDKDVRYYESNIFVPVNEFLAEQNAQASAYCLVAGREASEGRGSSNLAHPDCLENRYQSLFQQLLELLLFDVLKVQCRDNRNKFSISVYVATRARKKDEFVPEVWEKLPEMFGLATTDDRVRTVTGQNVHILVSQVLALGKTDSLEIAAARASKLQRDVFGVERPRPAHHLADIVARYCRCDRLLHYLPTLQRWTKNGFIEVADVRFKHLLAASRHVREGRLVDALFAFCRAGKISSWAKNMVSECAQALNGWDFIEFCDRIETEVPPPSDPVQRSAVTVEETRYEGSRASRTRVGAQLMGRVSENWKQHPSNPYSFSFIMGNDGQNYFFKEGDLAEGVSRDDIVQGRGVQFTVKRVSADEAGAARNVRLLVQ
jgi:hypothetical protein